jgi:hypothetical protein
MQPTDLRLAATGREEMGFWPAITFAYLYLGRDLLWFTPRLSAGS